MGLFSFLFAKKKKPALKEFKTERLGMGMRLAKAGMSNYTVVAAVTYEGKPIRKADFTVKARSRDHAASMVQEKLAFKVVSAHKDRAMPKGPK